MYVLLNKNPITLSLPVYSQSGISDICNMVPTVLPPGSIVNVISYDGVSLYVPPQDMELKQVDSGNIGDFVGL